MIEKYYNIHGIIKFKITDKTSSFYTLVKTPILQYENFEEDIINENHLDILFVIGNFKPLDLECNIVGDGEYYFNIDYMYVSQEHYKFAKWKFEVKEEYQNKTTVNISCNLLGKMFIVGNVMDFIIHQKLLEKNCPLIHASAVGKDNEAVAFAARGGGGKSTIALELTKKGWNYLGDNYAILQKSGVLSFPTPMSIFTYNLDPLIKTKLSIEKKLILNAKGFLYWLTNKYAKFYTKINPEKMFGKINNNFHKLNTLFILTPYKNNIEKKIHIKRINHIDAIKKLILNQKLEFPFFNKYIEEYSYLFPRSKLASHWDIYEQILKENMKGINFYDVLVPMKYDKMILDDLWRTIKHETNIEL